MDNNGSKWFLPGNITTAWHRVWKLGDVFTNNGCSYVIYHINSYDEYSYHSIMVGSANNNSQCKDCGDMEYVGNVFELGRSNNNDSRNYINRLAKDKK